MLKTRDFLFQLLTLRPLTKRIQAATPGRLGPVLQITAQPATTSTSDKLHGNKEPVHIGRIAAQNSSIASSKMIEKNLIYIVI